jgi:hypothetical protein
MVKEEDDVSVKKLESEMDAEGERLLTEKSNEEQAQS